MSLRDTLYDPPAPQDQPPSAEAAACNAPDPCPAGASPIGALTAGVLDLLDHGAVLLDGHGCVLHANKVARRELGRHGALRLDDGRLVPIRRARSDELAQALLAARRGLRTLLHFDGDEHCLPMVVLPMAPAGDADLGTAGSPPDGTILVVMAKRSGTEPLNIELFGRAYGLTPTERSVLQGLSRGLAPKALARAHDVSLSTVRCQILGIRQKTRTASIRQLLNVINNLPPVVCALEQAH
jgi:DNA-binding CsgD family transcriptional regulator